MVKSAFEDDKLNRKYIAENFKNRVSLFRGAREDNKILLKMNDIIKRKNTSLSLAIVTKRLTPTNVFIKGGYYCFLMNYISQ